MALLTASAARAQALNLTKAVYSAFGRIFLARAKNVRQFLDFHLSNKISNNLNVFKPNSFPQFNTDIVELIW